MRFGSNDYRLVLRGYGSDDMFPIIGRNGSALVQPGPNMRMGNSFPSKGQGTIIKDSMEGYANIDFTPVSSDYVYQPDILFNNAHGYTCWDVYRGSGTIRKQESHGQDALYETFLSTIGKTDYPHQDNYFFAVPVPNSRSKMRVVGNGGKPVNVTLYNEENSYFVYTRSAIFRTEVYVVIKATCPHPELSNMLDANVVKPYVLANDNWSSFGSVYPIQLSKAYSWCNNPSGYSWQFMQLWYGVTTVDIIAGGLVSPPVILMQDGVTMVDRDVNIEVQTTYLLKDD